MKNTQFFSESVFKLVRKIKGLEFSGAAVIVIGATLFFVMSRLVNIAPRFSDEQLYLYLAHLISEGQMPYRDFFYSSPPLIPYFLALYGMIVSFKWQTFNVLPGLLTIIDVAVLYFIGKRYLSSLAAIAAPLFYIFSFMVITTTDFLTDVHVVTTLSLLGAYAGLQRKFFWSGVLFGLATLSKLYGIVLFAPMLVIALTSPKGFVRTVVGFTTAFGGVVLGCWLYFGPLFMKYVFASHDMVPGFNLRKMSIVTPLKQDIVLFSSTVLLTLSAWLSARNVFAARSRRLLGVTEDAFKAAFISCKRLLARKLNEQEKLLWLTLISILALVAFAAIYDEFYSLYWKTLAAWLAILWSWNIYQLEKIFPKKVVRYFLALVLISEVIITVWLYLDPYSTSSVITDLEGMDNYVSTHIEPTDVLYGDYNVTTLLAIRGNRKIYKNYGDSARKFFDAGVFDLDSRMEELRRDKVKHIITFGVVTEDKIVLPISAQVLPFEFFTQNNCHVEKLFPIESRAYHNAVLFWNCEYS